MRYGLIVLWMVLGLATPAMAQLSIGIGLPGVSIGINVPVYPELVRVPGYPVYYAPRLNSNFFFYDGLYWVYQGDNWYASSWYNGPWGLAAPEAIPLYVLRIPVSYYRNPPGYFRGWRGDAPPRWGEHWGNAWQQHRSGWDRWNRNAVPAPAPLPAYQRQYSGNRYPRAEQQPSLHVQNYRYQPHDTVVQQHYQEHVVRRAQAPAQEPQPQGGPPVSQSQPPHRGGDNVQRPGPAPAPPPPRGPAVQEQRQQPPQGAVQREQQPGHENTPQGKGAEPRRSQGPEKGPDKGEDHGRGRDK